ncbi:MAG TPA: ATP-binding protein [Methanomassiliicoccales archaeon]|nr:ATP-binding protein [Bacteroidota bacterium]HXZ23741.1 ATP-binding protein [Methanomassiliicoccales archaeon]
MKNLTLQVESRTERLIAVRDFVSDAARAFGFDDEDISKIALAVDEACTNVIKHAYKFDPTKTIQVVIHGGNRTFEVAIRDDGLQFNPTQLPPPDMKEYLTHFRKGGLGVHLMKSLMDKVEYSMAPGKINEVRLIKYLPG